MESTGGLIVIHHLPFHGDEFGVQELSKHTQTQIVDFDSWSPSKVHVLKCPQKRKEKSEFVHVVPFVVSIWLLLVSSVQGPVLHFHKGKPSSENQEPWVGLRLTRDSRLWSLVWVSQSQPVFSNISYFPPPSLSQMSFVALWFTIWRNKLHNLIYFALDYYLLISVPMSLQKWQENII